MQHRQPDGPGAGSPTTRLLASMLVVVSLVAALLGGRPATARAVELPPDMPRFDVINGSRDDYENFILSIVRIVSAQHEDDAEGPRDTDPDPARRYLPISITSRTGEIRLIMRVSDLYIVGFWRPTDGQDGHYYALSDEGSMDYRYSPNTDVISITGTYRSLGLGNDTNLANLRVGRFGMSSAVDALATEPDPVRGRDSLRAGLGSLIVMVAEAARFNNVRVRVRDNWESSTDLGLPRVATIHSWSAMSADYIEVTRNPAAIRERSYGGNFNVPAANLVRFLRTALRVVLRSDRYQPGGPSCGSKGRTPKSLAATSEVCTPLGASSLTPTAHPNGRDILFFSGNSYANVNPAPGTNADRISEDTWADVFATGALGSSVFPAGIDAVVQIPRTDHEAWVFSGSQYARIQVKPGDLGPKLLAGPNPIKGKFPSLTKAGFDSGVDAALDVPGVNDVWFFRGDQYVRVKLDGTDDTLVKGPMPIADNWPSLTQAADIAGARDHYADFTHRITGAVSVPGKFGQAYVFSGSQYVRILAVPDSRGDRIIDGPKDIAGDWPSLVDAGFFTHYNHLSPRDVDVKSEVFTDDFQGPAGSKPDPKNWSFETGGTGWGNKERQYYTDSADNAHLDGNGNLVIEARKDNTGGLSCWYGACEVTSARLVGAGKVTTKYGRIEAKIKVTGAKGAWPAFWMLGENMPGDGWPKSGEIDIMENIGNQPNRLMGTVHGPGYSASGGIGGELMNGQPLGDDYHTYRVDWGPDRVTWYFDGAAYLSVGKEDLRGYTWVFDHPFYPILNLAVGGDLGGTTDLGDFPTKMYVDYVKISDLGGQNPPQSNAPTTGKGWRTWRPEAPAVSVRSTADNTVLDVEHGSRDKGARVVTWDYTDADNQRWQLLRHAWDNDFMYRNIGSQLVLDKDGGGTGALQWEFNDSNNQDWVFADAPGGAKGEVQIKNGANGYCLTNKGRGNQVDTQPCRTGDRTQVWMLDDVHKGPDLGKPTWEDWHVESKGLNIESASSGEFLDVAGASGDAGAKVVTWNGNGQDNQKWRMYRRTTENRFMFRNINSALALDRSRSGTQIAQYEFGGDADQEWIFEDAAPGTVYIRNGMGNGCLTDTGHGNQVEVRPCTGDRSQTWRLKEAPDTP